MRSPATTSPGFVADFDSSTALVRALAAALQGHRFRRLGRSSIVGTLAKASAVLPEAMVTRLFSAAGAAEAINPRRFSRVALDDFASWVTSCYERSCSNGASPAVAIGSSDGAIIHLCASAGIPWLPQTFLVPVKRRADPDDVDADVELGLRLAPRLTRSEHAVKVHQVHDANQDRLMVRKMAYFRLKMLRMPDAYRRFITRVLAPGGTIVIVDDTLRWPTSHVGERHVFQAGAFGGLSPGEYVEGGTRVSRFLSDQRATRRRWQFPPIDSRLPEAEWGYDDALTDDILVFARQADHHVVRISFPAPGATSPYVADVFESWFDRIGVERRRLLVETFICVEPTWSLATGFVPFWLPFPVVSAADELASFLENRASWDQIAVTLFAHGVRSAGLASARTWQELVGDGGQLAGVDVRRWPLDFAALARYSDSLDDVARPTQPMTRLAWSTLRELMREHEHDRHSVAWTRLR